MSRLTSRGLRRLVVAGMLLLALTLAACSSGESTVKGPIAAPLKLESASVQANPTSYSGPCSGTQQLTFTAKLTANASNAGGAVHYVWTINHAVTQSEVTFGPGEVTKTLTQTYAYTVPADAGPQLLASFATTTPNAVSAPDTMVSIACTVLFQITGVSVTMQPWSTDCGPHTFGWSALLTAPPNNAGGTVNYAWKFGVGEGQGGSVTFAPGQINAVVAAEQSYTVVPNGSASSPDTTPSPGGSQWPAVTPSQIIAWLYVTSPNSTWDYASLDHYSC